MKLDKAIQQIPYALKLGIEVSGEFDDGVEFELAPNERFIGNPMLRAFHGGIICGYMECAMSLTAMWLSNTEVPPRLVNQTTSFLGSASIDQPLKVRTELTKGGKRILGVFAKAYQGHPDAQLVAKCSSIFRVRA